MKAQTTAKKPYLKTEPMVEMYRKGLSINQIGKKFGVAGSTVRKRLIKVGTPMRSTADYEGPKRYWLWKGDNYLPAITRKRNQRKHRIWSKAVLERDKFQCQDCGAKKVRFHAHHIISLKECINTDLEYDVSNGVTLCVPCHGGRHKEIGNRR